MKSLIEGLETRRLFANAVWDGGGGTSSWINPANWVGDVVPVNGDDVTVNPTNAGFVGITPPPNIALHSLTAVGSGKLFIGDSITIEATLHVTATCQLVVYSGVIGGTGRILIDATASGGIPLDATASARIDIPVDNYGTFGFNGGRTFGPEFHNYGTTGVGRGGDVFGAFINESTGTLRSSYSMPQSQTGKPVVFGRYNNQTVPFINRGTIYTSVTAGGAGTGLTPVTPPAGTQPLKIYVDASSELGGSWNSSNGLITFAAYDVASAPAAVTFNNTTNFVSGTFVFDHVDAKMRGVADGIGLDLSNNTQITLTQARTSLALLRMNSSALVMSENGNSVFRVQDTQIDASATVDIGDNLFIAGNAPGFGQPWITNPTAPTDRPVFANSVKGSVAGVPVTVNVNAGSPDPHAVAYALGAGLRSYYAGAFRGETFDDNDFIFLTTYRGDANLDRTVDFTDLVTLSQHYGQTTLRGVVDGNFDSPAIEGPIDFTDLVILSQNYGRTMLVAPPLVLASTQVVDAAMTTTDTKKSLHGRSAAILA